MDFLSKWLDNDAASAITASTGNNLGLQKKLGNSVLLLLAFDLFVLHRVALSIIL